MPCDVRRTRANCQPAIQRAKLYTYPVDIVDNQHGTGQTGDVACVPFIKQHVTAYNIVVQGRRSGPFHMAEATATDDCST